MMPEGRGRIERAHRASSQSAGLRLHPSDHQDNGSGVLPSPADPSLTGARRRVLIVEDEWLIAMSIEDCLVDAGYQVVGVAGDAAAAVNLAGSAAPDLVLMDIRLGKGGDGVAVAREIRERYSCRCLFISAHSDPATITRTLAVEPVGWLAKPFTQEELLAAVGRAIANA
jgi:DNA-binding NarL/FixJ family response regulator